MTGRWLSVKQAEDYSGRHAETIRDALRAKTLRGVQRVKGGTWSTKAEWLDEWMGFEILEDAA